MAKSIDVQKLALEALAQNLADPAAKVLLGSGKVPGFFKGAGKVVKDAAKLCEDRQWLVATGEWVGKGKTKKPTYRLSPAGIQAVFQESESTVLLQGLAKTLQDQVDLFRSMQQQFGQMVGVLQPVAETVQQLAKKMEPPDVEAILRRLNGTDRTPPASPSGPPEWLDTVIRLASEQQQRDRYQPLTLPSLYASLRQLQSGLTLGQFHDGLRLLHEQKRIRLSPYTRALATIEDHRNALFLDGEVMYHVELP